VRSRTRPENGLRLIDSKVITATQVVPWAPWEIPAESIQSEQVRREVAAVKRSSRTGKRGEAELPMFAGMSLEGRSSRYLHCAMGFRSVVVYVITVTMCRPCSPYRFSSAASSLFRSTSVISITTTGIGTSSGYFCFRTIIQASSNYQMCECDPYQS
jgi:hypothetical protein